MIRHFVFVRDLPESATEEWQAIMAGLNALVANLPGSLTMDSGANLSPEVELGHGFSQGFAIDFADPQARDNYLSDPRHIALGQRIFGLAPEGKTGVFVFDMSVAEPSA